MKYNWIKIAYIAFVIAFFTIISLGILYFAWEYFEGTTTSVIQFIQNNTIKGIAALVGLFIFHFILNTNETFIKK